ncbi:MAG: LD-carboxypeptidase [Bacteroidales bacterium]|jgi:muramoyltetrapeptide carboxypeptidase|nr:LD-carboxypeptidase [Bacteroidales bacterium]
MITPAYLQKGDKIGIVAPARKISLGEIALAIKIIKNWGFIPLLGKDLFNSNNQFSGTDKERADDMQEMLDDKDIKAIFCARGGYGSVKIIEYLNFEKFTKSPKWIVGYSDITVFHSYINTVLNTETLHATMPINFTNNESIELLKTTLTGSKLSYKIKAHKYNKPGTTSGEIIGGNLSVLYSIAGTKYDIDTNNKILFIEDLDEYLYHIDRMMMNMKLSGKLDNLKGLIIGGMNKMNDNTIPYGKNAYKIINEVIKNYNYPVCFNFKAGHIEPNLPLILGRQISLNIVKDANVEFSA